jgi:hypothetical protein
MEASVDREQFVKAVTAVLPGIAKKELFHQADKLGIQGGALVSYNDEISIRHDFPQINGIEGALDGDLLHKLLGRITDKEIRLNSTGAELRVSSEGKGKKMRASLKMSELELPISEIETGGEAFDLPDDFRDNLRLIGSICARDMSRPVLTCIHIGNGWMEGSDTYRLARIGCADLPEMVLPAVALIKIADYEIKRVSIGEQRKWAHFTTDDGTTISCRLFSERYPRLGKQYNNFAGDSKFEFPDDIGSVLDRAKVFAERDHTIDEEISIELRPHLMVIKAHDDNGRFEEEIDWSDNAGIEASFSIHPDFLQLALDSGKACELDRARIRFSGDNWDHIIALR